MTKRPKSYDIPIEDARRRPGPGPGGEAGREGDPARGADGPRALEPEGPPVEEDVAAQVGSEGSYQEAIDHLRRLQAEFANYRRRTERERMDTAAWAQSGLVEKLLPVLDDFDRAVASLQKEEDPHLTGFAMIREKLFRTLADAGLERVPSEGETFDPGVHEALMTQPVEPGRVGTVLLEFEPGYSFKGKLVRPARVQVGVAAE